MKLLLASLVLTFVPTFEQVSLSEIQEDPVAWRGIRVEFVLQLEAPLKSWRPWLTRFDLRRYAGYSAWGDEQLLWNPVEFSTPATRIFARRDSDAEKALRDAPPYRRFRISGVVRNVFESKPWIEILEAKPLERSIGQGSLIHAGRALEHDLAGRYAAAAEQYGRALAAPMPSAMHKALEAARVAALKRQDGTKAKQNARTGAIL